MKVLFLRTSKPMYGDSAYLLGGLAHASEVLHTQNISSDEKTFKPRHTDIDVIVDRSLQANSAFFHSLDEVSRQLGVPVVNNPLAALAAVDKRTYSDMYGEIVPPTTIASSIDEVLEAYRRYGEEIVLKVPRGRMGEGVEKMIDTLDYDVIKQMLVNEDRQIIVQPYLSGLAKGDLRIILQKDENKAHNIVGNYLRTPGKGQWKSNLSLGGNVVEHELTTEEEKIACAVAKKSGLDLIGIDLGYHEGRLWLIETNAYTGGQTRLKDPKNTAMETFVNRVRYLANKR